MNNMAMNKEDSDSLNNEMEKLVTKYGVEATMSLVFTSLSKDLEAHWKDSQPTDYALAQNIINEPVFMDGVQLQHATTSQGDTEKTLLHAEELTFNQLKEIVEHCLVNNLTCHLSPRSWKDSVLIELQDRDEAMEDVRTIVERNNLAEA